MDKQLYKGLFIICGQIFEKKIYIYILLYYFYSRSTRRWLKSKSYLSPHLHDQVI